MKRAYTQYVPIVWRPGKYDPNEFYKTVEDLIRLTKQEHKQHLYAAQLAAERSLADGLACRHLFLTNAEFVSWLQSCGSRPMPEHLDAVAELLNYDMLVLHFPTGCRSSFMLELNSFITKDLTDKSAIIYYSRDSAEHLKYNSDFYFWTYSKPDLYFDPHYPEVHSSIALIMGLALYISAFPETVCEGLPDDLKHPSHHKYANAATLVISEKVCLGGTHNSPTPHYRVGHFRVLRSEKFKHKKFQTVFVHGTFVKGKAATVLSPEEVAE